MIVEMTITATPAQQMTGSLSLTGSAEIATSKTATATIADVAPEMTITDELEMA